MREYVAGAPWRQSLVDLFEDEWSSAFPSELGLQAGQAPLFDDERIHWLVEQAGGLTGTRLLELGPLEGGHTSMLLAAGADEVVGVEGNVRAFLRCLVAKEAVGMTGARFLLGEVGAYVDHATSTWGDGAPAFDLVVASGVLYHLLDPADLVVQLGRLTDRVFVWTHYVDRDLLAASDPSRLLERLAPPVDKHLVDGTTIAYHPHGYALDAIQPSFCGGPADTSVWMELAGLRSCLAAAGFTQQLDAFHQPDHPSGPAIAILASRPDPRPADRSRPAPMYANTPPADSAQVAALPRAVDHAALEAEVEGLRHALAEARAHADALTGLLDRRDLRALVRKVVYPWREGTQARA